MLPPSSSPCQSRGVWSTSEHERFLQAIALYPKGPWPLITAYIGTRSSKQVQTHAQKYQHKLQRHQRGLRKWKTKSKRPEHRVDATIVGQLMNTKGWILGRSQMKSGSTRDAHEGMSGSEQSASDCTEDSDWSFQSDLDAFMEANEPVPFRSEKEIENDLMDPEDHLLLEALTSILSWPPAVEIECAGGDHIDQFW